MDGLPLPIFLVARVGPGANGVNLEVGGSTLHIQDFVIPAEIAPCGDRTARHAGFPQPNHKFPPSESSKSQERF